MKCINGYEVEILRGGAGYYKGTLDEEGYPNCRISGYAKTAIEAENLDMNRQFNMENSFCNGGCGCFKWEEN